MVPTLGSQVAAQQWEDVDQKRRVEGLCAAISSAPKVPVTAVHVVRLEDET